MGNTSLKTLTLFENKYIKVDPLSYKIKCSISKNQFCFHLSERKLTAIMELIGIDKSIFPKNMSLFLVLMTLMTFGMRYIFLKFNYG